MRRPPRVASHEPACGPPLFLCTMHALVYVCAHGLHVDHAKWCMRCLDLVKWSHGPCKMDDAWTMQCATHLDHACTCVWACVHLRTAPLWVILRGFFVYWPHIPMKLNSKHQNPTLISTMFYKLYIHLLQDVIKISNKYFLDIYQLTIYCILMNTIFEK